MHTFDKILQCVQWLWSSKTRISRAHQKASKLIVLNCFLAFIRSTFTENCAKLFLKSAADQSAYSNRSQQEKSPTVNCFAALSKDTLCTLHTNYHSERSYKRLPFVLLQLAKVHNPALCKWTISNNNLMAVSFVAAINSIIGFISSTGAINSRDFFLSKTGSKNAP